MTLGRCPLSIFCSRGTPPPESINQENGWTLSAKPTVWWWW